MPDEDASSLKRFCCDASWMTQMEGMLGFGFADVVEVLQDVPPRLPRGGCASICRC